MARGLRFAAAGAAALSAGPAALLAAGFLAAGALQVQRLPSELCRSQSVSRLASGRHLS